MYLIFNNKTFLNPVSVIQCFKLSEVENTFAELENILKKGFYLAGFICYETGYAFEKNLSQQNTYNFPLISFGIYHHPSIFTNPQSQKVSNCLKINSRSLNITKEEYLSKIKKIKHYLSVGDTYQVNYTFKYKFEFFGDPFALFLKSKRKQTTPYSAYLQDHNFTILSFSPELFFKKHLDQIVVKPMKGTIKLGRGNKEKLKNDSKNQSENLMIVDLLRNDLGRIAKTGTVKTIKLFEIERYETLYQMTSTIEAKIPRKINLYDLFRNIFPSGSVTGAPKIRTMQIIRELEKEDRKIYCGAIGFVTPQKDMLFNVAIRTILLHPSSIAPRLSHFYGEMGIGSGIVYDSEPEKEFSECLLKAKFLL